MTNDGLLYNYSKELVFGKANSQGSNLRLDLEYMNGKNACEVITDSDNLIRGMNEIKIKGSVHDLQGNLINVSCDWSAVLTVNNAIF
jgi:hypothetical protein